MSWSDDTPGPPAPVYEIKGKFVRVCWDGWMYELPSASAHNYQGRSLQEPERVRVDDAIADGTARKIN